MLMREKGLPGELQYVKYCNAVERKRTIGWASICEILRCFWEKKDYRVSLNMWNIAMLLREKGLLGEPQPVKYCDAVERKRTTVLGEPQHVKYCDAVERKRTTVSGEPQHVKYCDAFERKRTIRWASVCEILRCCWEKKDYRRFT